MAVASTETERCQNEGFHLISKLSLYLLATVCDTADKTLQTVAADRGSANNTLHTAEHIYQISLTITITSNHYNIILGVRIKVYDQSND